MSTPRTQEDGGVPRQLPREHVVVRGSRGKRNPTISQDQLRKTVNQDLSKTRAPASPGPFKAKGRLEEVVVRAKKIDFSRYSARMLRGLLNSRGFTNVSNAYLGQYLYDVYRQWIEQIEREQLDQDAEAYSEIEDAAITGVPHTGMEEVVVTAPMFGKVDSAATWTNPAAIYRLATRQEELRRLERMEHIHVTAPRITRNGTVIREIEYTWEYIQNRTIPDYTSITPQHYPGRPTTQPVGTPKDTEPQVDPFPRIDPGKIQNINGVVTTKITPTGFRLIHRLKPRLARRRKEENKRRKDRKLHRAAKTYRRVLRFVNITYGTADEMEQLWDAIAWNITINNKPLIHYANPVQALQWAYKTGIWNVDVESMIQDLAVNWATDKMIGKAQKLSRAGQEGIGLNPGTSSAAKPRYKKRRKPKSWNDYYGGP